MPIWKHILEDLAALASLVLMPYVFIALGLALASAWLALKHHWPHHTAHHLKH